MTTTTEKGHGLRVGDILASSWGYDQTNWDFYRVVKRTATMVYLVKLSTIRNSSPDNFMVGTIHPKTDGPTGQAFRRKVDAYGEGDWIVRICSYEFAHKWDGRPKQYTSYA